MVIETHPIQMPRGFNREATRVSTKVTMRAYEVYCHIFSPQEKLITGGCRGGFGIGELTAFLYAYPFPKSEWRVRVDEAMDGMKGFS